ncbi:MAG: hypothetical protein FWE74_03950 [Oscillospiraceae bacterium]|nr:hypothetical protein [Oscillospiraceae bacterium]
MSLLTFKQGAIAVIAYMFVWAVSIVLLVLLGGMIYYAAVLLPSAITGIMFAVQVRKAKRNYWRGLLFLVISFFLCIIITSIFPIFSRFAGGGGFGDLITMLGFAFAYPIIAQTTYTIMYFKLNSKYKGV